MMIDIFEASKHRQYPQNASMQNKILRLTDKQMIKERHKGSQSLQLLFLVLGSASATILSLSFGSQWPDSRAFQVAQQ